MQAGLIGSGIGASITPLMHEAEARAQGFAYRYGRLDVTEPSYAGQSLQTLIEKAQAQGYAGLNITHPFKTEAVALMDDLSPIARSLGAVNTVVFTSGARVGHNTDYSGFRAALERDLAGARFDRVALFGAGGAGVAVALALVDHGVGCLQVVDRHAEKAEALRSQIQVARPAAKIDVMAPDAVDVATLDGAVNATPLGMASYPGVAFDPAHMSGTAWVADIVYFPAETALLARANMLGLRTMPGTGMALFQAVAAFELITGRRADPARMQATLSAAIKARAKPQECTTP